MNLNFKKILKQKPFILAPMDDVTDIGFRKLCEKHNCSFTISELTSVDAFIREKVTPSRFEKGNLKLNCVQFFGKNSDTFVQAAKKLGDEADIIDVNFGCPSPSVTGNQAGSFLLKDPKNVGEIISKLVKNINKSITAKIRLGYDKATHLEIAKEIEDAGASLITVHGRTAKQKYSGKANWNAIREVHETLKIPVIGNGDIKNEEQIDEYLNSHCSGLMIGREAIGNPLLFEIFQYYYKNGKKLQIDDFKQKQKQLFLEYLEIIKNYEFHNKPLKIQRQAMWFMRGIWGAKDLRVKISKTCDIDEIIKYVQDF